MAKLIPSFFDDQTPDGEREVFNYLKGGDQDWVALHSLDLAPWANLRRTEVDFVIIVPDIGIVCMEVKSHPSISFDGTTWHPNSIKRSPFKQAADARYTFSRHLAAFAPKFSQIPIVHICVFPRARFDLHRNLAVKACELIDGRLFRSFRSGTEFCATLKSRMRSAINEDIQVTSLRHPLSVRHREEIVRVCLPVQKRRPDLRDEIEHREREIHQILRAQQKPVLTLAHSNPRVIVSGPAGTGKTLIAMEVARRVSEQGLRVALLCFNQLIGNWITSEIEKSSSRLPNLVIGRAIQVMMKLADLQLPACPTDQFWDCDLYDEFEGWLTDPQNKICSSFDCLVIDEAQDILARPRLWESISGLLVGGLESGSYFLFGDFEHQVLAEREEMISNLEKVRSLGRPTLYSLTENCRNFQIVGNTAVQLAGFTDQVYSDYLREVGEVFNYGIKFYKDLDHEVLLLKKFIQDFISRGYKPSEITILSFVSSGNSVTENLMREGFDLRPFWKSGKSISYASVQSFKGLENKVIILTDLVFRNEDSDKDLFYIGMTRSTDSVRILCSEDSKGMLASWIAERLR